MFAQAQEVDHEPDAEPEVEKVRAARRNTAVQRCACGALFCMNTVMTVEIAPQKRCISLACSRAWQTGLCASMKLQVGTLVTTCSHTSAQQVRVRCVPALQPVFLRKH